MKKKYKYNGVRVIIEGGERGVLHLVDRHLHGGSIFYKFISSEPEKREDLRHFSNPYIDSSILKGKWKLLRANGIERLLKKHNEKEAKHEV